MSKSAERSYSINPQNYNFYQFYRTTITYVVIFEEKGTRSFLHNCLEKEVKACDFRCNMYK